MSQLRDKENGCEWDKEQTFQSIAPHTIEEAYEVVDAINRSNISDLEEELGDLLLQVVFPVSYTHLTLPTIYSV